MSKKIVVTGGSGRFGNILRNYKTNHRILFPGKKELNILNVKSIEKYLKQNKPDILIHLAGLSRPMKVHEQNISKSIDLNIIGTANVTKACEKKNIKLIFFSTNYVNHYAWSKLGAEASVQLYENSLIVRVCMTEKPFVHKKAFANVRTSFAYHDEVVRILFKILNQKGILNVGGKSRIIYEFAKKDNKFVKKIYLKKNSNLGMPFDSSINISKLRKITKL